MLIWHQGCSSPPLLFLLVISSDFDNCRASCSWSECSRLSCVEKAQTYKCTCCNPCVSVCSSQQKHSAGNDTISTNICADKDFEGCFPINTLRFNNCCINVYAKDYIIRKKKLVPVSAMLPGCYLVVCLTSSAGGPNIIVKVSVVAVNYTVCAFEFAQRSLGMNGTEIAGN